jgi:energy-coupling factor transport system permease protein
MTLRFVPRFKTQLKVVSNAQKCVGRDVSNGSLLQRAGHGIKILSIMVTWALENAIETADSMKSRGYGLPGRTAFSIYRLDKRDKKALYVIGGAGLYILTASFMGGLYWRYFPSMKGGLLGVYPVSVFLCYLLLCSVPIVIEIQEERKWKSIQSKI